jgi:hypothetical protein
MGKIFLGLAAAALIAGCATTATKPDLTVSRLEITPAETTAGSSVAVSSEVTNTGGAATGAPAVVDVEIFATGIDAPPLATLTGWQQAPDATLAPGEKVEDEANARMPGVQPGSYNACAIVDPENAIDETHEDNNRLCTPLTILAGAPRRADFVIEKITSLGAVEASVKVKIKIKNAGAEATAPIRIMAFRRSPRLPLLLTECALTEGQLASGSPASCDDLTLREPLAAGASTELTGYFAFVVAHGASFVRTPVGPNANPPVKRTVDFMVDGCFPPEDGSPVYCAVDEIDELNNFSAKTLTVR